MLPFLPRETDSNQELPEVVIGYASVRSQGGTSVFALQRAPESAEPFYGSADDRREAQRALETNGFRILAESRLGYSVEARSGAFAELTGGEVVARERLMYAEGGEQRYVTHLDIVGAGQPEALGLGVVESASSGIEGLVIEQPRIPAAVTPSPLPPSVGRFHLRVPDDVALVLGASLAHRRGQTGGNVNVTMVDSGQAPHPFFLAHRYAVRPTRAMVFGTSPTKDPVGHGTGESANIFAVAPDAVLQPIRVSNSQGALVAALGGFLEAKSAAPKPRIITNSWGSDYNLPAPAQPDPSDLALIVEVQDAIEQGIVVVFSAGNGQFGVEPQIPGVIAAGGVYLTPEHTLRASDYASGYRSQWFGGVDVPTVSGLVGLRPRAQYLMLPIPPGCEIDIDESQPDGTSPGDGTRGNDGWALFSGTSAAAPQIAGACALILAERPGLTPAQVRECLVRTATDVIAGRCHPRFDHPATAGTDLATGAGLVNAAAAVEFALGL